VEEQLHPMDCRAAAYWPAGPPNWAQTSKHARTLIQGYSKEGADLMF
jgi:hypothetical protein